MTTEQDAYRNAQSGKPRQPRQHRGHLTVRYRWLQAPDGLERMSKAYSILLQGGSNSSGKQPEVIKKDEGEVNTTGGQGEKRVAAQSATHKAEQ